ncbi:MAG: type I methionyl aminopeptidase [Gammaproteobacteria bacterium]|nr:MAG: type I methionyl aminopeptidase [Gammaproteobacteria bacterium]RLA11897.1 MAG: type I methionyl aminopeptidase [Gammaproteobacteria bacterium]RLA14379.1 MAG: type I methionyl aminopeptidase [Gammaproteobacteria bacterium]
MTATIKTDEEIIKMRDAGQAAAELLSMLGTHVQPGISTDELNEICEEYTQNTLRATSAPLNYHGFPKSVCTSVNHVVCHGIPNDKKLKNGDIVNLDVTILKDGYHGDTSAMFAVGKPTVKAQRLMEVCREAMQIGLRMVAPGVRLGDIGHAIQEFSEAANYSVVREYCGHGIGSVFHEDPQVLHYGVRGTGMVLQPGMTFTIEPMLNIGKRHVKQLNDGWTVVTRDRSLSAQWEHTVLVTDTGYEILTLRQDEVI